jgi:hypothetical protein
MTADIEELERLVLVSVRDLMKLSGLGLQSGSSGPCLPRRVRLPRIVPEDPRAASI